jgi:hypothetical protein
MFYPSTFNPYSYTLSNFARVSRWKVDDGESEDQTAHPYRHGVKKPEFEIQV